jgi:hypothetical protein
VGTAELAVDSGHVILHCEVSNLRGKFRCPGSGVGGGFGGHSLRRRSLQSVDVMVPLARYSRGQRRVEKHLPPVLR